jgi:hypothetical protein
MDIIMQLYITMLLDALRIINVELVTMNKHHHEMKIASPQERSKKFIWDM